MNARFRISLIDNGWLRPSIWERYILRQLAFIIQRILSRSYFTNTHNVFQLMRKLKLKIFVVRLENAILDTDR